MANPFDIVIFGGSGDLALRKLIPAMYRAYAEGKLPKSSRIFATCRKQDAVDSYIDKMEKALQSHLANDEFDTKVWSKFKTFIKPIKLDIVKVDDSWSSLAGELNTDKKRSRVFYLAISPSIFGVCCQNLQRAELITENSRVVVEKPLGYDGESAEVINTEIAKYFAEDDDFLMN